jgi:hypothetical protein
MPGGLGDTGFDLVPAMALIGATPTLSSLWIVSSGSVGVDELDRNLLGYPPS